jgi:hypothetical protein
MSRTVFQIANHHAALQRAGLTSIDAFRSAIGEFIKNHLGIRDIIRLDLVDDSGKPLAIFLKRNLQPIRKHAWRGLLRHGKFISSAELEWANLLLLNAAGVATCRPAAVGAEFNAGGETFSFIATEAAPGVELEHLARTLGNWQSRRRVSVAVARTLRRIHDARIGLPTVFGRHLFIDGDPASADALTVTLIDLDRVKRPLIMTRRKARDLAQLHLSIPKAVVTVRERLRFLRDYAGGLQANDVASIRRFERYLERKKHNLARTYHGT